MNEKICVNLDNLCNGIDWITEEREVGMMKVITKITQRHYDMLDISEAEMHILYEMFNWNDEVMGEKIAEIDTIMEQWGLTKEEIVYKAGALRDKFFSAMWGE